MVDRIYNNVFLRLYDANPALFAILLIFIGYSLLNITDAFSKALLATYSVFDVLFWSSLFSTITMLFLCQLAGFKKSTLSKNFHWHLIRGIAAFGTISLVFTAIAHLTLANFYAIIFLCPIVCVLLSWLFFKDELGKGKMMATALGFIGVLIIIRPGNITLGIGFLAAFAAVFTHASSLLIARKMGKDEPKLLLGLTRASITTVLAFIATGFEPVIPAWQDMTAFLALGIIGIIGATFVSTSFQISPSTSTVAPFHYVQMLWGIVIGYFFWAEIPSIATLSGSAVIMASGLWIILLEKGKKSFAPKSLIDIIEEHKPEENLIPLSKQTEKISA